MFYSLNKKAVKINSSLDNGLLYIINNPEDSWSVARTELGQEFWLCSYKLLLYICSWVTTSQNKLSRKHSIEKQTSIVVSFYFVQHFTFPPMRMNWFLLDDSSFWMKQVLDEETFFWCIAIHWCGIFLLITTLQYFNILIFSMLFIVFPKVFVTQDRV